jgi:hypothetical protein
LEVIRAAVRVRRHKGHLASLARDHNVGLEKLESFAVGQTSLPPDVLDALAKALFGNNVSYLADTDKLHRAKQPATPLGVLPPTLAEMGLLRPQVEAGPAPAQPGYGGPPAKAKPRAGWTS